MSKSALPQLHDWLPSGQTLSRMNTISIRLPVIEPAAVNALLNDVTRACVGAELAEIDVPENILAVLSDEPPVWGCGKYHGISLCTTSGITESFSLELKFRGCQQAQRIAAAGASAGFSEPDLPTPNAWLPKMSVRNWLCSASIDVGGIKRHTLNRFVDEAISVCRRRDFNLLSIGLPGDIALALPGATFVPGGVFGDYGGVGIYGQELYSLVSILEFNFLTQETASS